MSHYSVGINYKETVDGEWKVEYIGEFQTEEECEERYDCIVDEWIGAHDPYEWNHDLCELEDETGKELQTRMFVVTLTVKDGANGWEIMRNLENAAYDQPGVYDFDYAEQEVI